MIEHFSRYFGQTVCVVSVEWKRERNLMTAVWVTPLSSHPPLVGVTVSPLRYTHYFLEKSKEFGLNILSTDQVELSQYVGTVSGGNEDKFSAGFFAVQPPHKIRAPLIAGCFATMECKSVNSYTIGDHTLFIGQVLRIEVDKEKNPLLLHQGGYYRLGGLLGRYRP